MNYYEFLRLLAKWKYLWTFSKYCHIISTEPKRIGDYKKFPRMYNLFILKIYSIFVLHPNLKYLYLNGLKWYINIYLCIIFENRSNEKGEQVWVILIYRERTPEFYLWFLYGYSGIECRAQFILIKRASK